MITAELFAASRLAQFASTAVLFGAPAFHAYAAPGPKEAPDRLRPWLLTCVLLALASGLGWLMAETATMTGTAGAALDPSSLAVVLTQTRFGAVWGARLGLMLVTLALLAIAPRRAGGATRAIAAGSGAILLASLCLTGHAAGGDGLAGAVGQGADALHLLAAGAWLGALAAMTRLLLRPARSATPEAADRLRAGLQRFSGMGSAIVAVLLATGLVNSWILIGPTHILELPTSPYGRLLLVKIGLFAAMLALAAANRFALTPRLARAVGQGRPAAALIALRASVALETALGVLVLAAVSWLGMLEPMVSDG